MCGVTLRSRVTAAELPSHMNVRAVFEIARRNRLILAWTCGEEI